VLAALDGDDGLARLPQLGRAPDRLSDGVQDHVREDKEALREGRGLVHLDAPRQARGFEQLLVDADDPLLAPLAETKPAGAYVAAFTAPSDVDAHLSDAKCW
jgi:hypothetical protein